jgi:hypothetical protein
MEVMEAYQILKSITSQLVKVLLESSTSQMRQLQMWIFHMDLKIPEDPQPQSPIK